MGLFVKKKQPEVIGYTVRPDADRVEVVVPPLTSPSGPSQLFAPAQDTFEVPNLDSPKNWSFPNSSPPAEPLWNPPQGFEPAPLVPPVFSPSSQGESPPVQNPSVAPLPSSPQDWQSEWDKPVASVSQESVYSPVAQKESQPLQFDNAALQNPVFPQVVASQPVPVQNVYDESQMQNQTPVFSQSPQVVSRPVQERFTIPQESSQRQNIVLPEPYADTESDSKPAYEQSWKNNTFEDIEPPTPPSTVEFIMGQVFVEKESYKLALLCVNDIDRELIKATDHVQRALENEDTVSAKITAWHDIFNDIQEQLMHIDDKLFEGDTK